MSNYKAKVVKIHSGPAADDHLVRVSESLMRKWGISANQPIHYRFGTFRTRVRLSPAKQVRRMRISKSLAAAMGLSRNAKLRAVYSPSSHTLSVGPLIGVLMPRVSTKAKDRPFGDMTDFCLELTAAAKKQGAFVYFFPPSGIEENRDTLQGWAYEGGWRQKSFPLPDVIHNRLTSRKLENLPEVQQLFKKAKQRGAHVFNEKYVDKTEVFAALKPRADLAKYLPESHPYNGFETLRTMAGKYSTVFLKPAKGSLGKGIIRISKTSSGNYVCLFSEQRGTRKASYATLAKVYAAVSHRIKRQKYQIQQGIRVIKAGGRPADFRALVQKDVSGKWAVTSIVGRIAGANQIVTNLAKGGTIAPASEAIARSNLLNGKKKALAELRRAALAIAEGIESTIQAHFGELGIDLALDQSGRIWLIEVNSKPSKNDNTLTEGKIRPSVKKLVEYARYLSKH